MSNIIGQPVAWAITDVEDVQSYQEFFKAVKRRVPEANITILMTDDGKYNYTYECVPHGLFLNQSISYRFCNYCSMLCCIPSCEASPL